MGTAWHVHPHIHDGVLASGRCPERHTGPADEKVTTLDENQRILEIRDLYVNFYTKSGVVKALDGVSIWISKGETFGLVGESGCGKTVTANSVLRLIASPPGKIESGKILFMPAEDVVGKLNEFEEAEKRLGKDHPDVAKLKTEVDAKCGTCDVLVYDKIHLQEFRGKAVSMIFQEPMSALNPVFPAGAQISEVLLLHERADLAKAILRNMDERLAEIDSYHRVGLTKGAKGEYRCDNCGAQMAEDLDRCPQCGGSFKSEPFRHWERYRIKRNRRYFVKMAENPKSRYLRWTAKIPIWNHYMKFAKIEAKTRAERMLRLVRIPDPANVVKSYPHELSGGMQQRVMIAMALACKPRLLIADEPTTALDVTVQAQILKLMRDLQTETGTSILLITHNLGVVAETCDRVGVMYAGTMAEVGVTTDIFKDPLHPYTQGLMNLLPKVHQDVERLETIEGTVPNLLNPPPGCRFHPRCPYAMAVCKKEKPPMQEIHKGHFTACHLYQGVAT
ncbi:MAG: ATP-binding cassette domain-containing protein [Methanomassiliicoccales archaeon]|nr:ATP-binding cassette domain-containing protein [Methanomassiliicoccales archaeon]